MPLAQRGHRPGWRDPRLWVGIVLVAGSVVLGGRVVGAADDTVQLWAAESDLGAGHQVATDDLVALRVRFADTDGLAGYFTVDDELPAGLELTRSVSAGELLPRQSVGDADETGLVELPVAVEPELAPPGLTAGDVVDVYLLGRTNGAEGAGGPASAAQGPALASVTVVDAPEPGSSFGTSGRRQLVLAVPDEAVAGFFALLARHDAPSLTVVRRR